jgi:hypothetical protein
VIFAERVADVMAPVAGSTVIETGKSPAPLSATA